MATRAETPAPKPGSARGAGAASTPPQESTVSSNGPATQPAAKPGQHGNASPTLAVWSAAPAPGNQYSSPRYQVGPQNEVMDDLAVGRDTKYGGYAESYLTGLAKALGHNRTASSLWNMAVEIAKRDGITVNTAIQRIAQDAGYGPSNGSGAGDGNSPQGSHSGGSGGRSRGSSGGSGGSGGVSQSINYDNAPALDVRSIADQVAMEFLGRGVTQDEMRKILARVRMYENNNPSVSSGQAGAGVSVSRSQGGATNAGRQQVIEKILAKNPGFGDYQKATTMMDWFNSALQERLQNG